MSRFEDRVANHSLRTTMGELRAALEELPEDTVQAADENAPAGVLDRAGTLLDFLDGLLEGADARLVPQAALDSVHGNVDQALTAIRSLPADPATHGANLDQAVENALQNAVPLVAAAASFAESAQKLGRRSGGLQRKLRRLAGETEAMEAELQQLEEKAGAGLQQLTSEQQERRKELTAAIEAVKASIDTEEQRVSTLSATFKQRFESEETARTEAFDALATDLKEQSQATSKQLAADAEAARAAMIKKGEAALADVVEIHEKVDELYGVITDTATAGAFRDEAKAERSTADHWRKIAIGFGTAAVIIGVAAIALAALIDLSPAVVVAKVTATLACLGVAGYAAQQSSHHRKRGDQAKDLELELVTAEGFLHGLNNDDETRELRKGYFERAFRGRDHGQMTTPTATEAAAFGLTPELLAALMAMLKAGAQSNR